MIRAVSNPEPAPSKLQQVVEGAAHAFALAGYHRTQMADIAERAGVALGTLYRHAESKEELFAAAMALGMGQDPAELAAERPIGDVEAYLARRAPAWFAADAINARLLPEGPLPSVRVFLGAFYDLIAERRLAIRILDRSAHDLPRLGEIYTTHVRAPAMAILVRYLEAARAAGRIAPMADVRASARLIVEVCAWFAMHRLFSPGGNEIPDDLARATALNHLCAGFGAAEGESP